MTKRYLRLLFIKTFKPFWYLFSLLIKKRRDFIAINTFPDFDDTLRSFSNVVPKLGLKLVVLTTEKNCSVPIWLSSENVIVAYRYSLMGIWLYHRSGYVFFTHGLFSFWRTSRRQKVINLWHGMPIKNIGLLDGKPQHEIPIFDYTIAYDIKFQSIISKAFGVPNEKVLISGHPRIDCMYERDGIERLKLPSHTLLSIWLPTYRSSKVGDIRSDGDDSGDIFSPHNDLSEIDYFLRQNDCICILKPHPMAKADRNLFNSYSNIVFVDDKQLAALGITLYQLLGISDILITDVSSVYIDYKYTANPSVIYCPDFLAYKTSRGFVTSIVNLIDDAVVIDKAGLVSSLQKIFSRKFFSEYKSQNNITKHLLSKVGVI